MNNKYAQLRYQHGFSIIEVILAIIIASIALAGTITAFSSNLIAGKRAADRKVIEEIIARDLGWIRNYAKTWKMQSGPYDLSSTQTTTSNAFEATPYISYAPNSGGTSCAAGLLSSFILNAGGTAGDSMIPVRPFSIPQSSGENQQLTITPTISGISLWRKITYGSNSNDYTLQIYYWISGSNSQALRIQRESSVYIEAAAWCDS